jgi:hypothetical protein
MHIEKNVLDNIIGTLLGLKGKTKDNYKARLDLEEMGLKGELHPIRTNPNKTILPAACFNRVVFFIQRDLFQNIAIRRFGSP